MGFRTCLKADLWQDIIFGPSQSSQSLQVGGIGDVSGRVVFDHPRKKQNFSKNARLFFGFEKVFKM